MIRDFQTHNGLLILPEGIQRLEGGAYAGEGDIRRVVLPDSVTFIGEEVFSSCVKLEEVVLSSHITELHAAVFSNCESLRRVVLPPQLSFIGEGAFLCCPALEHIELPETMRTICEMAFWGTGLREITVPAGVTRLGDSAFWDCGGLRKANVLGTQTQMERNVFGNCPQLVEGYIAPGYAQCRDPESEMVYSLLWASCPDRHPDWVAQRAETFIRANEQEVMERVLETDNIPAMTGIAQRKLLRPEEIDDYVRRATQSGKTELTALLLQAKGTAREIEEEFEL
ncbi:MAG: leucine-rich repeat domain-containing protein [Clostridiales bacterium]|nr:leucine-rich repeat domain-containing protein [Candidatus Cacconaster stercorequi]